MTSANNNDFKDQSLSNLEQVSKKKAPSTKNVKKPKNQISNNNLEKIKKILEVNGQEWKDEYKEMIEKVQAGIFKECVQDLQPFMLYQIKDYKTCLNKITEFSGKIQVLYLNIRDATKSISFILDLPELIQEKKEEARKENNFQDEKFFDKSKFLFFQFNNEENLQEVLKITFKLQDDINQYCINKGLDPNGKSIMGLLSECTDIIEMTSKAYFEIALLNPDKIEETKQNVLFLRPVYESFIKKLENHLSLTKDGATPGFQVNLDKVEDSLDTNLINSEFK